MKRALDAILVLSAATLILIASIGGIDIQLGQLSIRARDWLRPAMALVLSLSVRAALSGVDQKSEASALAEAVSYISIRGLLALIVAAVLAYSQFHVRVAGGLDSYGYVSTARLIASGHLSGPQPLASILPFPIR